jgi:hypothetical protein
MSLSYRNSLVVSRALAAAGCQRWTQGLQAQRPGTAKDHGYKPYLSGV